MRQLKSTNDILRAQLIKTHSDITENFEVFNRSVSHPCTCFSVCLTLQGSHSHSPTPCPQDDKAVSGRFGSGWVVNMNALHSYLSSQEYDAMVKV